MTERQIVSSGLAAVGAQQPALEPVRKSIRVRPARNALFKCSPARWTAGGRGPITSGIQNGLPVGDGSLLPHGSVVVGAAAIGGDP